MTNENTFNASSGYEILNNFGYFDEIEDCYEEINNNKFILHRLRQDSFQALREYFRHERDQQLGRWRWPENPNVVIYRDESKDDSAGRCIIVIREDTAATTYFWEKHCSHPDPISKAAAKWFFEEGPGKEPERPWEDAQPGEVWRLTVEGREDNTLVTEAPNGKIYFRAIKDITSPLSAGITAGRKVLEADGSPADDQG